MEILENQKFWTTVFIGLVTITGIIAFFVRRRYSYWKNHGLKFMKPTFPFGNLQGFGISRHTCHITQGIYEQFKGKDLLVGAYFFLEPVALVLDPELIKNVLVRDFSYFHGRGVYHNEKDDPLSGHLISLDGNKWKNLRAKLTPTFTSGKMKMMFDTVLKVSNDMKMHLAESASVGEELEIKDILSRYTIDVIGSCAFGIDCNSLKYPDTEFRTTGRLMFEPPPTEMFKVLFASTFPKLARRIKLQITNKHVAKFFTNVVQETLTFRKQNKIERNDFMQLLLEMENENDEVPNDEKLSLHEIAAQSLLFFLVGYETSSSTMTFCLYELGRHLDMQEKVRDEIESVLKKYDGKITYDSLLEMPYLDKVINEGLRKYPAVNTLIRIADRDYKVPNTNYVIEKGRYVLVPVYGIHHDENIYPDPEKFDPERFNDENIAKRHPYTYLPFGEGPRICIGLRFGMMQTRLGLISILRNYKVSHCTKTIQKPEFIPSTPIIAMKGGVWLKIENVK